MNYFDVNKETSVQNKQEQIRTTVLQNNLNRTTLLDFLVSHCYDWDCFVDDQLSYLTERGFDVHFWSYPNQAFATMMQIADLISISSTGKQFDDQFMAVSLLYIVIGSKDIMGAFNVSYNALYELFLHAFPIDDSADESIQFYNSVFTQFVRFKLGVAEFDLSQLKQCVSQITKFFILDLEENNSQNKMIQTHNSKTFVTIQFLLDRDLWMIIIINQC